jgi:transcriptional regulator with XRE-family HTH domain
MRDERGYTREVLAERANVSRSGLAFLETDTGPRGEPIKPSIDLLKRISTALGVHEDELRVRAGYLPVRLETSSENDIQRFLYFFGQTGNSS